MIIDAHHHLWQYNAQEYEWIGPEMQVLRRDFLPEHLEAELAAAGVDAAITVQARQTIAETEWLLSLAAHTSRIAGVVGWAPLTEPSVKEYLEEIAAMPKLRGMRHVLQAEADDYCLSDEFNRGIAALKSLDLRYDILIFERQLPAAIALVDRHPKQVFILDHLAKPQIKRGELEPWRTNIIELARRPNVFCKLSGMVTEADWRHWSPEALEVYAHVALEAFGTRRLMFGSDWPVCLVASTYRQWLAVVQSWVSQLTQDEQAQILGQTAMVAYGLQN